jgi:ketosteroid isomerase-like protein
MNIKLRRVTAAVFYAVLATAQVGTANATEHTLASAQHAYLAAINANDPEQLVQTVTRDVVFITPNAPALEGKTQLRAWARRHFNAVAASWEKTPLELVVSGDWAFETYTYRAVDTPRRVGPAMIETGNGLSVYHRENDKGWRVARDVWATHERWAVFEDGCDFTRLAASAC